MVLGQPEKRKHHGVNWTLGPVVEFLQDVVEGFRLVGCDEAEGILRQSPRADVVHRRMNGLHEKLGKRLTPRCGEFDQTTQHTVQV